MDSPAESVLTVPLGQGRHLVAAAVQVARALGATRVIGVCSRKNAAMVTTQEGSGPQTLVFQGLYFHKQSNRDNFFLRIHFYLYAL